MQTRNRAVKETKKRKGKSSKQETIWHKLNEFDNIVFYHRGFKEEFEVVGNYNFPHAKICEKIEIILARSHKRPVFIEFTHVDLNLNQ